jgi:hypothetical protein
MPIASIRGNQFTVTIGSTDYSAQITEGTISRTGNAPVVKTLTGTVANHTDNEESIDLSLLYDEDTGLYNALETASDGFNKVTFTIKGGDAQWTGSAFVAGLSVQFQAEGLATCNVSLQVDGVTVFADAP